MPILHSPGVMTPGQLGPIRTLSGWSLRKRLDLHHVEDGNAFGDGDDDADARVGRFHDRIGRERRRDEDHRRIGAGCLHRLCTVSKIGRPLASFVPPLPGVTPPTIFVPYSRHSLV